MAQGKRRDPQREARWREALACHARGGLKVRAFCRREGLPESAFYAWRRIIQHRDAQGKLRETAPPPPFVPLRVRGEDGRGDDGNVTIELRGGRVMRVPLSMPPAQLAAILRAIEDAA